MDLSANIIATLPMWFVAFLFSLTCHEAAHALVAKIGGDLTAYHGGQVSLDPLPHIRRHPFGTIVVPIISFFIYGGGWMIGWGSAPLDPIWVMRHPRRAAWVSAAGPAANLILVILSAAAIHIGILAGVFEPPASADYTQIVVAVGGGKTVVTMFISIMFSINLILMTFNLLPVPPLDGHGVVGLFLSETAARRWHEAFSEGTFAIMGLLVAWVVYGRMFGPIFTFSLNLLYPGARYS